MKQKQDFKNLLHCVFQILAGLWTSNGKKIQKLTHTDESPINGSLSKQSSSAVLLAISGELSVSTVKKQHYMLAFLTCFGLRSHHYMGIFYKNATLIISTLWMYIVCAVILGNVYSFLVWLTTFRFKHLFTLYTKSIYCYFGNKASITTLYMTVVC